MLTIPEIQSQNHLNRKMTDTVAVHGLTYATPAQVGTAAGAFKLLRLDANGNIPAGAGGLTIAGPLTAPSVNGYLSVIPTASSLPSSPLTNQWVVVANGGSGTPALELWNGTAWKTLSGSGGTAVGYGTRVVIAETAAGSNIYPVPYSGQNELIEAGGSPQVRGSDYILNGNGTLSFTPALPAGVEVLGTATTSVVTSAGSHFVEIGPGNGTKTAFALPGSGLEEQIVLGHGYTAVRGTQAGGSASGDYYISGAQAVFFVAPASGVSVLGSCSVSAIAGTDAQTLQGHPAAYFLTATAQAADSASLGGVAAANYALKSTVSTAAFAQMFGIGDLATMAGLTADFHRVKGIKTAKTVTFTVGTTPVTGTITYDILKNGASIYTAQPTLTCNGTIASMAATISVSLVDGDILVTKIISAPAACTDFRLDIYDS